MSQFHGLKCWPEPFRALCDGSKTHEIRVNDDRDFRVGDRIELREWKPDGTGYTGDVLLVEVTYITQGPNFGLPTNIAVMSVARIPLRSGI